MARASLYTHIAVKNPTTGDTYIVPLSEWSKP
jgi:hypothetical protein